MERERGPDDGGPGLVSVSSLDEATDPMVSIRPEYPADLRTATVALDATLHLPETAAGPNSDALDSGALDDLDLTLNSQPYAIPVREPDPPGTRPHPSHVGIGYELHQMRGVGGMGEVWEARQRSLGRRVALKRLRPGKGQSSSAIEQFESEARFAGVLDHSNIVTIYEFGHDQAGRVFYTMKLIEGTAWDRVIYSGKRETKTGEIVELELRDHLEILLEVSQGIAFAHSRGVIHRDIKPGNVMIGDYGEVLIVDWGLAVAVEPREELGGAETWTVAKLPEAALVCGTPAYMAPETAASDGELIGLATDVYLLGAVLFHLLYGRPPHKGNDVKQVMANAKANAWAFPRVLPGKVKPWDALLRPVIHRSMATDPLDRFADAGAFGEALRKALRNYDSAKVASRAESKLAKLEKRRREGKEEVENGYQRLAAIIAQLEGALESWPRNLVARQTLAQAHLELADLALDKGDLVLAELSIDNYENLPPLPAPSPEPQPQRRLTLHPVDGTLISAPRPTDAAGTSNEWVNTPDGILPATKRSRELALARTLDPRQQAPTGKSTLSGKIGVSSIASVQIQQDSSASMVDGEQRLLARSFGLRQRIERHEADARKRRRALVSAGALSTALFVAFVVALAIGGFAVSRERDAAELERDALSRALLEETMDTVVAELELQFRPVHRALMTSLRWAEAGSLDTDDPEALNRYFMPLLAEVEAASSLLRADTSGYEYMLLSQGESWRTRSTTPGQNPTLREWSLAGQLSREWTSDKAYSPHRRPWYLGGAGLRAEAAKARREGQPLPVSWTEPYTFFTTKELGISVSAPATSVDDRAFVIAFDVKLGALSELTARLPEDFEAGQVFVLDEQFRVLGLPREVALTPEEEATLALTPMDELDMAPVSRAAFLEWRERSESSDATPWRLELGEDRYWVSVRKVETGTIPPMWIGVVVPETGFMGK